VSCPVERISVKAGEGEIVRCHVLDHALALREGYCLCPTVHSELDEDPRDVRTDRLATDEESLGEVDDRRRLRAGGEVGNVVVGGLLPPTQV
jgi:hypothetical protein